jgi:hypothetical protein
VLEEEMDGDTNASVVGAIAVATAMERNFMMMDVMALLCSHKNERTCVGSVGLVFERSHTGELPSRQPQIL